MKKNTRKSTILLITLLLAGWSTLVCWQWSAHLEVRKNLRAGLLTRVRDISSTLGVVIRSERKMGAVDPLLLKRALKGLTNSEELLAIAILSPENDIAASSHEDFDSIKADFKPGSVEWDNDTLLAVDLIELGKIDVKDRKKESLVWDEKLKKKFSQLSEEKNVFMQRRAGARSTVNIQSPPSFPRCHIKRGVDFIIE